MSDQMPAKPRRKLCLAAWLERGSRRRLADAPAGSHRSARFVFEWSRFCLRSLELAILSADSVIYEARVYVLRVIWSARAATTEAVLRTYSACVVSTRGLPAVIAKCPRVARGWVATPQPLANVHGTGTLDAIRRTLKKARRADEQLLALEVREVAKGCTHLAGREYPPRGACSRIATRDKFPPPSEQKCPDDEREPESSCW